MLCSGLKCSQASPPRTGTSILSTLLATGAGVFQSDPSPDLTTFRLHGHKVQRAECVCVCVCACVLVKNKSYIIYIIIYSHTYKIKGKTKSTPESIQSWISRWKCAADGFSHIRVWYVSEILKHP